MKRIAAVLTVLLVSIFLVAGSATALVIPYWTLSDHTAGDDGTANFTFTFENASVDNAAFGVFFSNSTFDAITDQIDIFTAAEGIGFSAVANFAVVDAAYSLALTVTSPLHEIVRQSSISDIDPLLFGFYFRRDLDPVGVEGLEDRLIYSDSAYSSNEGQNTMHMVWRNDQTDQVSVQLQYDGVPRYGVLVSDVTPVPEPATMFLLGTGLIGLAGFGRKKFFKKLGFKEKSMRNLSNGTRKLLLLIIVAALAGFLCPPLASAVPILGSDLASFTVLGASTVTNVPTSTIVGNVGVWSSGGANAITGFLSSPGVATSDPQVTGGQVHAGTALAESAQGQLTTARNNLSSLGPGTTLDNPDLTLEGTLFPGVYTVPAGTTNLSGALTLDGQGNDNAAWVFQMPSTLITSPNSVVNVINTGSGAGVFWNVGSSATIDTNTTFMGNILALESISMNATATDLCGRALADIGAVTLIQNSLSGICSDILAGSNGLSGGLDVITNGTTEVIFLPDTRDNGNGTSPVPEPTTMLLLGTGLIGLVGFRRRGARPRKKMGI